MEGSQTQSRRSYHSTVWQNLRGKVIKVGELLIKERWQNWLFVKINSSPFKRFPKSFPTPHSMCGNFSQQNFVFKTGTASQQRESKAALKSWLCEFYSGQDIRSQNNFLCWSKKVVHMICSFKNTWSRWPFGFIFIFQYRIKWNMCLSLLYPNSMLCKSFNKKRRFKNKLFFLLWIENISNNNRKYETFLYFYHKDLGWRCETESTNLSIL